VRDKLGWVSFLSHEKNLLRGDGGGGGVGGARKEAFGQEATAGQ